MEYVVLGLAALLIAGIIYFVFEYRRPNLITSGEVCDKKHRRAHTAQEIATYVGSMPVYKTVNYPERWTITFRKKDENGNWHSRTVDVSEETFKKYNTGDTISFRV